MHPQFDYNRALDMYIFRDAPRAQIRDKTHYIIINLEI